MIKIDQNAELDLLMSELFPFAEKMLRTYGEFNPFGGYIDATGRIVHAGLDDIQTEESGSDKLSRLVAGLSRIQAEKGARACGFVVNVALPNHNGLEKQDAIRFFLEHKDGYCADVFFCYRLSEENDFSVTKNFAQQGASVFFNRRF